MHWLQAPVPQASKQMNKKPEECSEVYWVEAAVIHITWDMVCLSFPVVCKATLASYELEKLWNNVYYLPDFIKVIG